MSVYKELGAKLKNFISAKTEEVDDKVEAIDKHERYVNTDLDYGVFEITDMTISHTTPVIFSAVIAGNMELSKQGYIKLQKGKTYAFHINLYSTAYNTGILLVDANANLLAESVTSQNGSYIYRASEDIEVTFVTEDNAGITETLAAKWSCVNVYEINRQIVIDPVEHVNDSQGIEDTPVGHIIAHMGTVAPKHYLICDGTEYNIADYPYLAQHIEDNFGSINFFGGDSETTFAVPDLRGEFLRGTGENSHENNGNGADVGVHQDATFATTIAIFDNGNLYATKQNNTDVLIGLNGDSYLFDESGRRGITLKGTIANETEQTAYMMASRPTNTSVLYCIKYEPTYFMNTYNTNYMQPSIYSEEERVVGCWTDGKPIYEKVITTTSKISVPNSGWGKFYNASSLNIEQVVYANFGRYNEYGFRHECFNELSCYHNDTDKYLYLLRQSGLSGNYGISGIVQYTKTTDEENSFTADMIKDSFTELAYTDEEIYNEVANILSSESNKGE